MLVPVTADSDKTTVSIATGHQEYHPVYVLPGNIYSILLIEDMEMVLCLLPFCLSQTYVVIDLSIDIFTQMNKTYLLASKLQQKQPEFQKFCQKLYHKCLQVVFSPLKPYMDKSKVVKCPDGHFCHTIFSLGPYIADYPEQVWLAGIVSNWCPKYISSSHFLLLLTQL